MGIIADCYIIWHNVSRESVEVQLQDESDAHPNTKQAETFIKITHTHTHVQPHVQKKKVLISSYHIILTEGTANLQSVRMVALGLFSPTQVAAVWLFNRGVCGFIPLWIWQRNAPDLQ